MPAATRYRTIVADPPWEQGATGAAVTRGFGPNRRRAEPWVTHLPYPTLTVDEIAALDIPAQNDAHLYLWTTQKFLRESFEIVDAWGFAVSATLAWCKAPLSVPMGGTFGASLEYFHFCRRGSLAASRHEPSRWFQWPRRRGAPAKMGETRNAMHSAKPEAFYDLVESVSPGPYLELFARRQRLGWDTWGDEALNHIEIGGAA